MEYKKVHIVRRSPLELSRSKVKVVETAFVSVNYLVKILQEVFNLQIFLEQFWDVED